MYSGKSKLCSSYSWDTALKFMERKNSTYPTNSTGGYYSNSSPTKTGYDTIHLCNIYDMGGNVWEWTTESCSNSSGPFGGRGGSYGNTVEAYSAAGRYFSSSTATGNHLGFRITLYL